MSEAPILGASLLAVLERPPVSGSVTPSVAWVEERRRQALRGFNERGLPSPREEAWRYTNVAPLTRAKFVPASADLSDEQRRSVDAEVAAACKGLEDAQTHIFINGHHSSASPENGASVVSSLRSSLGRSPESLEPHLGQMVNESLSGFSALNTAFFEDGACLIVPPDIQSGIVHLIHVSAGDEAGLSIARNVIVLEAGAQAVVVESYLSAGEAAHFCSAATEIVLGDSATLDHYRVQSVGGNAYHIGAVETNVGPGGLYRAHHVAIGGKLSRVDANVTLGTGGAACEMNGLYVVTERQHSDFHTRIEHHYPDGRSDELFKGILADHGRSVFNGLVKVHPDAQRTDSTQANHNLLLSENAEIDTKPELQIFADDVKCAHGATVGQLDDDMVFYLRSRGLDESQARATLTYAFAEEVIQRMGLPAVRHRVKDSLNRALPEAAELIPSEILFEQSGV